MQAVIPRKNYAKQTHTFVFLTAVIVITGLVYGYFQYQKLSGAQHALSEGQQQVVSLQSSADQLSQTYTSLTESYNRSFQSIFQAIESVHPEDEHYTKLTQDMDNFVNSTNSRFNPIFMSDIKFSKARYNKELDLAVLPFNLTLTTTKENFDKFLRYVEQSGALDTGTRLIDIQGISLNFAGSGQNAFSQGTAQTVETLSVSVALNAYFQPTEEMKTKK